MSGGGGGGGRFGMEDAVSREIALAAAAGGARSRGKKSVPSDNEGGEKKKRKPRTPVAELNVIGLQRYATTPAKRRVAAAALKTASYSFLQIMEILEYNSVAEVKRDVYRALGESVDPEDLKATRNILILQAEKQLQRSIKYASAEVLTDEDEEEHQNYEQLAWHHAAREDMRLMGQLTGAFAPTEIHHKNITEKDLDELLAESIAEFAPDKVIDAEIVGDDEDEEEGEDG